MAVLYSPWRRLSLLIIFLLTACSTLPEAPMIGKPVDAPIPFAFDGRLSLKTAEDSLAGKITWKHQDSADNIDLSSPFGQKLATIVREDDRYRLYQGSAPPIETRNVNLLLQSLFGWSIPIAELPGWTLGIPAKDRDINGPLPCRLSTATGWSISYDAYRTVNGRLLPTKMRFSNSSIAIQIVVDQWQIAP